MSQSLREEILSRSDYHRGLLNFIENNPGCTSDDMFNSDVANAIIPIGIREMAITLWIKQFIQSGEVESRNWKLYPTGSAEWHGHNIIKKESKMRITQSQLRRIIREEYSSLKRKGLIKENYGAIDSHAVAEAAFNAYQDGIRKLSDFIEYFINGYPDMVDGVPMKTIRAELAAQWKLEKAANRRSNKYDNWSAWN